MSSIAKTNISLSKKDLEKNRIPSVASRNIVFYHKATLGQLTINLLSLTMPTSEMPNMVQATIDEINGAYLASNKKNLDLVSSIKGNLIQGLDYLVTSSTTIQLIGIYEGFGAEVGEIFKGTVISSPVSNIVVASAKSVNKTYTLAVGQTILNLGLEYQVGVNPNESIGSIKVFVNGILALRNVDYIEVNSGNGSGSTIQFFTPPVSISHSIAVDFGVMSISDNNSIGAIENLSGAVKKIADDLAIVVGGSSTDYLNSNPSEVERRTFGDYVLGLLTRIGILESKYDVTSALSLYTKTKWQKKSLTGGFVSNSSNVPSLSFNNLVVGKTYRASMQTTIFTWNNGTCDVSLYNGVNVILFNSFDPSDSVSARRTYGSSSVFVATVTTVIAAVASGGSSYLEAADIFIEELPNHEITTLWT